MGLGCLKNLFAQLVLLQQMAEGQERYLVRDTIGAQLDAGKAAHGGQLDQGIFLRRFTEQVALLQEMKSQEGVQGLSWQGNLLAHFRVVGRDRNDQGLQKQHHIRIGKKFLTFFPLLGGGELVIPKPNCLPSTNPAKA